MKNKISITIALGLSTISAHVFAFNSTDSFDKVINGLTSLDCEKDAKECRYIAAAEYLAVANSCTDVYAERKKIKLQAKDKKDFNRIINGWQAINDSKMKKALLDKNNHFVNELTKQTKTLLISLSDDDLDFSCTRVSYINYQINPDTHSLLLYRTKNFEDWQRVQNTEPLGAPTINN